MSLTPDEIRALRAEYADLDARRADITERCDAIKAQLRADLPPGKYDGVTISQPRHFDEKLAEQVIPEALLAAVQRFIPGRTVIDQALCKEHLSPGLYRKCTSAGARATVKFT